MKEKTVKMKQSVVLWLMLLLGCFSPLRAADVLTLVPTSGEERSMDIALIGKWQFVDTKLVLFDKSNNILAEEETSQIKKITFAEMEINNAVSEVEANSIVIYPNPSQARIYVAGANAGTPIRVFDMQGHLLLTATGTECDVQSLAAGTYLLQIGTQVVRFIKQ